MRVNVAPIKQQKGASLEVAYEEPCPALEASGAWLEPLGPMNARLTVTNTGSCMLVQGDVGASIRLRCNRCLEPFTLRLSKRMEEAFYPLRRRMARDRDADDPQDEPVDAVSDGDAYRYSGDVLDLTEATRENLQLAIPIKVLCREDCRGLCPVCGKNRNLEVCSCSSDSLDPRLQVLAELLPKPTEPGEVRTEESTHGQP